MLSFWEKQHWTNYDLVIIGGGIVGLSTAISWKEKNPNDSVIILERGTLPTGASTRNAGFACFGSLTELLSDIKNLGEDGCLSLVERRWKGLLKLRERLGDENIDLQMKGGYELLREKELYAKDQQDYINKLLKSIFKQDVFTGADHRIGSFGFNRDRVKGMLFNCLEAQIDSGKMMKSLLQMAYSMNIEIRTGSNVVAADAITCEIDVEDTFRKNYTIKAQKIAICTNGFAREIVPGIPLEPGRGIVLVTEKIDNLPFEGTFHYEEGFYYFRDFYGHIMFGGGRNIALNEERTTSFEVNDTILTHLKNELYEMIIPGCSAELKMYWAGIMAFGENKKPVIQKVNDNVGIAVRLGGMGVAIGTLAGEELSTLLNERKLAPAV